MGKVKKCLFAFSVLLTGILVVGCSNSFSIDGMWESSSGEIYSFSDSSVSASLFGFSGGPDGSYTLSEKPDDDGNYILYGSHITGGEVNYSVTVENNDQISLTLTNESTFAPKSLTLERR